MEALLKREIILDKRICRLITVALFVILTALGAFVRIPLASSPVPITLQTLFVLLSASFLGAGSGALAQISYIFLGILGLPIFSAAGSGLIYLAGPTGGYLCGFVLAALFIGRLIRYGSNLLSLFILFAVGDFIILACGSLWLKIIFGYSLAKALFLGFVPFIPGDLIKAGLACVIYLRLKSRLKEIL